MFIITLCNGEVHKAATLNGVMLVVGEHILHDDQPYTPRQPSYRELKRDKPFPRTYYHKNSGRTALVKKE